MEHLTVVIADDDVSSRTILRHFIQLYSGFYLVGEASNGDELIEVVLKEKPDIVLVDIDMPKLNGIEAVKSCKEFSPSLQVIFTTGHDEFALQAFNISATDYLIKPIERIRLLSALEKAKRLLEYSKLTIDKPSQDQKITVKSYNTMLYLLLDDILFIEIEARKTVIHTANKQFETTETMQDFSDKLPGYFYKTHRSFLVNLKKIRRIESSGETFLAFFSGTNKQAYISKLKIQEVQSLIVN